jgi:hypothetical protein
VTLARRVAAVELTLSPTELVLRWLEEAHGFGSLEAYLRSIIADPALVPPADELARAAASGARASLRGKGSEAIGKAVDGAIRETIFRFELVLRINTVSHELIDRQMLLNGVFSAQLAMLATDGKDAGRRDIAYLERFTQLRQLIIGRLDKLKAAGQARLSVEERYLAGHPALFPDGIAAWTEQLKNSEAIGRLAVGLAEKDGLPWPAPHDPDMMAARIAQPTDDFVEPAKVIALEQLGEGRRAFGIATSWVRRKYSGHGPGTENRLTPTESTPTLIGWIRSKVLTRSSPTSSRTSGSSSVRTRWGSTSMAQRCPVASIQA